MDREAAGSRRWNCVVIGMTDTSLGTPKYRVQVDPLNNKEKKVVPAI